MNQGNQSRSIKGNSASSSWGGEYLSTYNSPGGGGCVSSVTGGSLGLPPSVQIARVANEIASQYNPNLVIDSCFSKLPQVACGNTGDCYAWMQENCTTQDNHNTTAVCDASGQCKFDRGPF
jgi:hypothetical protein